MKVSTGKVAKPQKVVVYGPEGIGKTTLAAAFPDPLFIDTEGGTHHFDVRRADPSPTSWSMLMGYIGEVASAGPALCGTVVVDTADWAERMCSEHVCSAHGAKGIEDFGYGKGYAYVKEEFGRLLDRLADCIQAGVNVVVCAHAQIRKFEQPDELGAYDRWELKLSRQCAPMLKEWADMVLFCNYETIVVKPDQKTGGHAKAAGGKRVMHAEHTPAWDAKNRCGLPAKMPMDYQQIAAHVPVPATPGAAASGDAPAPAAGKGPIDSKTRFEEVPAGDEPPAAPGPGFPSPAPAASPGEPAHLGPLRDLMAKDAVNDAQLQAYCGRKGYCTAETPVPVYPEDFTAYLVSDWANVMSEIGETPIK